MPTIKGVITIEEDEKIRRAQNNHTTVDLSDGLKISSADKIFSAQIGTAAGCSHNFTGGAARDFANSGSEFRRVSILKKMALV